MDIACKRDLDPLLKYDLVMARSSNIRSTVTNSFFMSKPKHPFIKYCIDRLPDYKHSYFFGKHIHVMNSTGPLFIQSMVKRYGEEQIEGVHFLSNKEYAGDCNACSESVCKGGVYFTHVSGNSWHGWDSTCYNFIMCKWQWVLSILILLFIFIRK